MPTKITPRLSVGGQIGPNHLESLASEGFTDIVCNRPDAEIPGGPVSATIAKAAQALGLKFHYLPIIPGQAMVETAAVLGQIVSHPGSKVFAYCRSGARSASAWQMAKAIVPAA